MYQQKAIGTSLQEMEMQASRTGLTTIKLPLTKSEWESLGISWGKLSSNMMIYGQASGEEYEVPKTMSCVEADYTKD